MTVPVLHTVRELVERLDVIGLDRQHFAKARLGYIGGVQQPVDQPEPESDRRIVGVEFTESG